MEYTYKLQIITPSEGIALQLNLLLGVNATNTDSGWWDLKLVQPGEKNEIDFVTNFMDLLEGKYEELKRLGINRENISIWMLYAYNEECNIELSPKDMKRMGDNGITLCISCWEEGSTMIIEEYEE